MPIIKYLPTAYLYFFWCCFLFFFSQILMERLQLSAFSSCLICYSSGLDRGLYSREKALEGPGVHYLANCYTRASNESADTKVYFPYEPWNIYPCLSSSPWFCKECMCPLASFPGPAQLFIASYGKLGGACLCTWRAWERGYASVIINQSSVQYKYSLS